MRQPIVLFYSHDQELGANSSARLDSWCRWVTVPPQEPLHPVVDELKPEFVVLDFRQTSDGGHAGDRLIEELQKRHPDAHLFMLTIEDCPEILARRAVCTPLEHLPGAMDANRLANALQQNHLHQAVTDRKSVV